MLHIITVNIYIFCDLSFVHVAVCCPPRPEPLKICRVHSMCVVPAYARASFQVQQGSFLGVHRPLAPHRHVIPHLLPKPGGRRKVWRRSLGSFFTFLLVLSFSEERPAHRPSPLVFPPTYSPLLFPQVTHRLGERGQLSRADFFQLNQNHLQRRDQN